MTNKKKVLGIPAWSLGENSFGVTKNYLEFLSFFGNARIIMPWEDFIPEIDLVYLPGGLDLAPEKYGEAPRYNTSNQDVFKEHFFNNKLDAYINAGVPVFGQCLGFQQLCVKYGAKMTQDLIYHAQSKDRWVGAHEIVSMLTGKKVKDLKVNSHHHQAIMLDDIGSELTALYVTENEDEHLTKKKWIVEAMRHNTLPIVGCQYHSEELYDEISINLINGLLYPETEEETLPALEAQQSN